MPPTGLKPLITILPEETMQKLEKEKLISITAPSLQTVNTIKIQHGNLKGTQDLDQRVKDLELDDKHQ